MLVSNRQEFIAKFLCTTALILFGCGVMTTDFPFGENFNFNAIINGSYTVTALLVGIVLGASAYNLIIVQLLPKRQPKTNRRQQRQTSEVVHNTPSLYDKSFSIENMSVDTPSFPLNRAEIEDALLQR